MGWGVQRSLNYDFFPLPGQEECQGEGRKASDAPDEAQWLEPAGADIMKNILSTIGALVIAGLILKVWTENQDNSYVDWLWLFAVVSVSAGLYMSLRRGTSRQWRRSVIVILLAAFLVGSTILCTIPTR